MRLFSSCRSKRTLCTASPITPHPLQCLITFYELQEEEDDFAEAVQLMIARTLSRKLGDARQQGSARGGVSRGAGGAESEIAKTARWQQREVELKLELEQSKAAVSSLRATFIAFVCLIGLSVYATSMLRL